MADAPTAAASWSPDRGERPDNQPAPSEQRAPRARLLFQERRWPDGRAPTLVSMAARASNRFDVVVVGGGHNGLVAGGPARQARRARSPCSNGASQVGGAAITEQPWGPDFKMTALVVRRQPDAADDRARARARAARLQGLSAARLLRARTATAARCSCPTTIPRAAHAQIAQFSRARRRRVRRAGTRGSAGSPTCSARCSTTIPPRARLAAARATSSTRLGSAWQLRGLGVRGVGDVTRLFTIEHRRPARRVVRVAADAGRARR